MLDILVGVFAVCMVAQQAVQSWFYVRAMEAQLKQAQAYQAMQKLIDGNDDKIRALLAKYDTPKTSDMARQVDEIRKKAETLGWQTVSKPKDIPRQEPVIPPMPEPLDEYIT